MKVTVGTTLLIVIIFISTLTLSGCDTIQMLLQPMDSDAEMPPSRSEAQAQAIATVKMLQSGQTELFQKAQETDDDSTLVADLDNLYLESGILDLHVEAGFTAEEFGVPLWYLLSQMLIGVHLEENPEEIELFLELVLKLLGELPDFEEAEPPESLILPTDELPEELQASLPTLWGLFVEFLQLSYQYPEKMGEEIFDLFRESARNGNTTINPQKVEASLGFTFQPGDILFWTYQPPVGAFGMDEPQP